MPRSRHRRRARHALIGATSHDVFVALAPGGLDAGELVDAVYVLRSRLNDVACADRMLRIDAGGVLLDVVLGRRQAHFGAWRLDMEPPEQEAVGRLRMAA
ncbi:hypothetical protein [Streptomyces atratus]|uniref:hypothetical protein n=1 Tax=Streptomyces atratus TaxID=1893 RepID=UPI0033FA3BB1